ncbi:MAG: DUF2490 domain-containing protein [Ignavibacteria bacterium]|nr:DUF2490 domain-containing protein [Ignavibacteria bacterium]
MKKTRLSTAKRKLIVVFFLSNLLLYYISINNLFAQTFELGSWNILHLKYNLNEKWSIFGEAQLRSLKFYNDFHYYEYKGGLNLWVHKYSKLTLGFGSYQTYGEGGDFVLPKNNDELRIWPQIILVQSIENLKIEQRYRGELRFTSKGYRNRFRYRLALSYPFGISEESKPFQISLSDEIFFTNKEPYFERNRFLLALNYKLSNALTLQVGYLHQFDYRINDEIGRDFLVVGLSYEILRKPATTEVQDDEIRDN